MNIQLLDKNLHKNKTPIKLRYFLQILMINNLNPLSINFTKWSNIFKQFVGNLPTNCLSVFGHFAGLELKGLNSRLLL